MSVYTLSAAFFLHFIRMVFFANIQDSYTKILLKIGDIVVGSGLAGMRLLNLSFSRRLVMSSTNMLYPIHFTTTTGHGAYVTTPEATLPSSILPMPDRPFVPITIKSAFSLTA